MFLFEIVMIEDQIKHQILMNCNMNIEGWRYSF